MRFLSLNKSPSRAYVVGDVHGRLDLVKELEAKILVDSTRAETDFLTIYLGDLIDRGPDAASVLDHMLSKPPSGMHRHVLLGNHEAMMLAFLKAPRKVTKWLDYGGRETLMSYGLTLSIDDVVMKPQRNTLQKLAAYIPQTHIDFMSSLPALLQFSDYILSHAGIDPEKPIENQNEHDLLWNKDPQRWLKKPPLGKIVIHGHVPIGEIETKGPWINLDTGAYATGRLSALCLSSDSEPRLLNVGTKM